MDHMDTEMLERDVNATAVPRQDPTDGARELLTSARQLINQGKPSQALQAVLLAMRSKGGDAAVFDSLQRARELYRKKVQESAAVDQLASLFAECVIAEAQPSGAEFSVSNMGSQSVAPDDQSSSILAETGRMQIVLDAFADGSSFICLQCGGLVSNHRKDEHYAYWCSKL